MGMLGLKPELYVYLYHHDHPSQPMSMINLVPHGSYLIREAFYLMNRDHELSADHGNVKNHLNPTKY